jgi:hypothetical protein
MNFDMKTFWKDAKRGAFVGLVPIIYVGAAYLNLSSIEKSNFSMLKLIIGAPVVYGVVFAVLRQLVSSQMFPSSRHRGFVVGLIAGEIYSVLGRFGLNVTEVLFKMDNPNKVHIIAPLMYSLIYGAFADE